MGKSTVAPQVYENYGGRLAGARIHATKTWRQLPFARAGGFSGFANPYRLSCSRQRRILPACLLVPEFF